MLKKFEKTVMVDALKKMNTDPNAVAWVETRLPEVYLDIRKGIVQVDDKLKPRDAAIAEAQKRYCRLFCERRKEELDKLIARKRTQGNDYIFCSSTSTSVDSLLVRVRLRVDSLIRIPANPFFHVITTHS